MLKNAIVKNLIAFGYIVNVSKAKECVLLSAVVLIVITMKRTKILEILYLRKQK